MKRSPLDHHPCSIAKTLDVVGEWWTPLILRDVAYGVRRFGEIQEDLGVSANVLADRLEALVREGILETHSYQERPPRHEYRLTEKGAELIPTLLALMQWGDRWKWPDGRGPVRVVHEDCGSEVRVAPYCPECARELTPAELRAKPRRGVVAAPDLHEPGHITGERLRAGRRDGLSLEG
ncbi:MAG TPA: helix-turn-helix domain-containing protein [Solirubrobacteraceae bacterium]